MKSPCIKICKTTTNHRGVKYCVGCGRSLSSIDKWDSLGDNAKEDILSTECIFNLTTELIEKVGPNRTIGVLLGALSLTTFQNISGTVSSIQRVLYDKNP